jgi:CubicO group peptidase (beta-lactamase class C family)
VLNDETDSFINQVLADWNSVGGVGVAVVRKDEQGVWNIETKGYGIATIDEKKVTEHTLFGIGSNSKVGRQGVLMMYTFLSIPHIAFQYNCYWAINP